MSRRDPRWLLPMMLAAHGCGGRTSLDVGYQVVSSNTGGASATLGGASTHAGGKSGTGGLPQTTGGFSASATSTPVGAGGADESGGAWTVGGTNTGGTSSSYTDSGQARAGIIAWTHTGFPMLDAASHLYTSGGGYMGTAKSIWMVNHATGVDLWSLAFFGDICGTKNVFVADEGGTLTGVSRNDGATLWSMSSDSFDTRFCSEASEVFFASEETSQGWILDAYAGGDGSRVWQTLFPAKPTVEHITGETLYVSWSTDGQTNLSALSAQHGAILWTTKFIPNKPMQFLFDAQEQVFAVDASEAQRNWLARLNTANGSLAWSYQGGSATFNKVVFKDSTDFVLLQEAKQFTALGKATGTWLWKYDLGSGTGDATSEAQFTRLGDVLLVRRESGQVSTTALDNNGRTRWTLATQVTEIETGDLYELNDNVLSRLDPYTGESVWSYASALTGSGTYELLGGHGDAVFLAGPTSGGSWPPPPVRTVTALRGSDGHLLWQSAEQVAGSLWAADDERIYLWTGATAKYDTFGVTTAIWFGSH